MVMDIPPLPDPLDYAASEAFWEKVWRDNVWNPSREWRIPYYGTGGRELHDGNPVFSAYCKKICRVVRIIQSPKEEVDHFCAYPEHFNDLYGICICLSLCDETVRAAIRYMRYFNRGKLAWPLPLEEGEERWTGVWRRLSPYKTPFLYPKRYATIIAVQEHRLLAKTDTGEYIPLLIKDRTGGRTRTFNLSPGVRIKIYKRSHEFRSRFRRVGR